MANPLTDPKGGFPSNPQDPPDKEAERAKIDPSGKGTHAEEGYGQGDAGGTPPQQQDTADVQQGLGGKKDNGGQGGGGGA